MDDLEQMPNSAAEVVNSVVAALRDDLEME